MDHQFMKWLLILIFNICLNYISFSEAIFTLDPSQGKQIMHTNDDNIVAPTNGIYDFAGYLVTVRKEFRGVKGRLNIWSPHVANNGDFSFTSVLIGGKYQGVSINLNAGWIVYPGMFRDAYPRYFASYTKGGTTVSCYSFEENCSAFVKTSSKHFTDPRFSSIERGNQYDVDVTIIQDRVSKNWLLQINGVEIGYWKASFVSELEDGATNVGWGGHVFRSASTSLPSMGSGEDPEKGFGKASYIRNLEYIDNDYFRKTPRDLVPSVTNKRLYRVSEPDYYKKSMSFYYGGPGLE